MENRAHALIAGAFVLLLGAAAAFAVWWFGGDRLLTRDFIVVTTQNIGGLNQQAQVRYRGIRVGRVESIRLDPEDVRNILLQIRIDAAVPVTYGTVAKLGYQGVTGIAHIQLEETGRDTRPLPAGETPARIAMQPSLIDELSDAGRDTMIEARRFLANINTLLGPENRDSIARTLQQLQAASGRLDATLAQVQQVLAPAAVRDLQQTLAQSAALSRNLNQIVTEDLRPLLAALQPAATAVVPLLQEARASVGRVDLATDEFQQLLQGLNNADPEGVLQGFAALSQELTESARSLNRVLQQLDNDPQQFLFGPPPALPGPGEQGFAPPTAARAQAAPGEKP